MIMKKLSVGIGAVALMLLHTMMPSPARDISQYVPVLESVKSKALKINKKTGLVVKEIGQGVYVISDGIWQSAFVVTGKGVVVLDAPQSYGNKIIGAVAKVTKEPIKMLVYSHAHKDHIGGSSAFQGIKDLQIIALQSVTQFLREKKDPNRLLPNISIANEKTVKLGDATIELKRHRNYHSSEGDLLIYVPKAKFLMAIDTLAPGYVPFSGFDLTTNFHEYLRVFDDILAYDFDTFIGGHLTHLGTREDVKITAAYTRDVYETVKRIHSQTDQKAVMAAAAKAAGGWDNKYLLFKTFLDKVVADATKEIKPRWIDKLAGVDVWADTHARTALIYVRWDD